MFIKSGLSGDREISCYAEYGFCENNCFQNNDFSYDQHVPSIHNIYKYYCKKSTLSQANTYHMPRTAFVMRLQVKAICR